MAQTGQIGGRLSEEELIGLLERFAGSTKKSTVKFDRRRNALDSDDDDIYQWILGKSDIPNKYQNRVFSLLLNNTQIQK